MFKIAKWAFSCKATFLNPFYTQCTHFCIFCYIIVLAFIYYCSQTLCSILKIKKEQQHFQIFIFEIK